MTTKPTKKVVIEDAEEVTTPTKKRIIREMTDAEIQTEISKPNHTPYMTVTLNGKQYIGRENGTLILKPRVFQTKTLYEVAKEMTKEIIFSPYDKIQIFKATKDGKQYTRIVQMKYDSKGNSVYKNKKTQRERPQTILNLPGDVDLVQLEA